MNTPARPYFGGKAPTPLEWRPLPYMQEWLDNLVADEKADSYIRVARLGMAHFALFAEQEGIKHPDEINRHHILRFQAYLVDARKENGDPFALSYRQQLMKYLRSWIGWLEELEHITTSPWVRIRIGRTPKKPKPLEDDEIAVLFDAHRRQAFSIAPFYFHRRETILALLYGWGLRLNELESLNVTQMDMRLEYVTVRNKGGGTKTLPYGTEIKQVVHRWLTHRAKFAILEEDALIIDQQGKRLRAPVVYKIVTELGVRAGISINPHRLRDSFGTMMLDNDVSVERLMKLMGHSQRSQTLAYARVNDHKVKEEHDRVINPLIHKLLGGQLP